MQAYFASRVSIPAGGKNLVTTGNAKVFNYGGNEVLLSYGVPVAIELNNPVPTDLMGLIPAGTYRTETHYSVTTECHITRYGAKGSEELPQAVIDDIYQKISRRY